MPERSTTRTVARGADIQPRPYQREALDAWRAHVAAGRKRGVIVHATGTGKTVTALLLAREHARVLFVAPRSELITQTVRTAERLWPLADVGVMQANRDEVDANQLVVCTPQTLAIDRRRGRLLRTTKDRPFRLVVADEAHHYPQDARWTEAILEVADACAAPVLGLTATPTRADDADLAAVWGSVPVHTYTIADALDDGYLTPYVVERVYVDADLARAARAPDADAHEILRACYETVASATARAVSAGRKGVVFAPSAAGAEAIAALLRDAHDVAAAAVSHATPPRERAALLARHRAGELRILTCPLLLAEGYDDTSIDLVVMARPVSEDAPHVYVQAAGRGLRLHPGKDDCLILDLVDAHGTHGLATAETLAGGGPPPDEPDTEASEREEAGSDYELARARAVLERGSERRRSRRRVRLPAWVTVVPEQVYALPAGSAGEIIVARTTGGWGVGILPRGARCGFRSLRRTVTDVDRATAAGIAIDYVHELGAGALADRDAGWRDRPASPRQVAYLRHLGANVRIAELTAGEAQDEITRRKLLRRLAGR